MKVIKIRNNRGWRVQCVKLKSSLVSRRVWGQRAINGF